MMTPQEVSERTFTKAGFGGYNMAMVDEFFDLLTNDYTALYKENAVLKSKMKILVDKVEEYRSTEEAMRKALLSAQRMADELVAEAESKKAKLLQSAEKEAKARMAALRKEVEDEEYRLASVQSATAAYVAKLKELCQHEADYLGELSKLSAPVPQPPSRRETIAQQIEESLERKMDEEFPDPADTLEMEPLGERCDKPGGIYNDIVEQTRRETEEKAAAQRYEEDQEDEEVTAETRRIPSRDDLIEELGFGRRQR